MNVRDVVSIAFVLVACGCGVTLAKPARTDQPESAFAEVPFPPPPPRAEDVPPPPRKGTVWMDGQWIWRFARWTWDGGGRVAPPEGGRYARWETRRASDGSLRYAVGAWRNARGDMLPNPVMLAPARDEPGTEHGPAVTCAPENGSTAGEARPCP